MCVRNYKSKNIKSLDTTDVVRDVENRPPTPAFSDLVQPELTTTYRFAGDCQVPAKYAQAGAIMGWDHGLS